MFELGLAAFVLAHAGIHASFVSPRPPAKPGAPAWPFELSRSWLLSPLGASATTLRAVGRALVAVTIVAFGIAALGILDVVPPDLGLFGTLVGATGSVALLGLFFHPWLVLGIGIDIGLVWLALNGAAPA